jgi:hypothetical protein
MGVVFSIEFFWSNMANPATTGMAELKKRAPAPYEYANATKFTF